MGFRVSPLLILLSLAVASAWSVGQLLGNGAKPSGAKKLVARLDVFNATFKLVSNQISNLENQKVGKQSFELLEQEISEFKSEFKELESELKVLQKETNEIQVRLGNHLIAAAPILPPCSGTKLRLSGTNVTSNLIKASNGVICIGNGASPSPNNNFLVFNKNDSMLHFLGTQSLAKDFIDFTVFVNWKFVAGDSPDLGGCSLLPAVLRGSLQTTNSYCSKSIPTGAVYLVHQNSADSMVDDEGAITVLNSNTETLWY